MGDARAVRFCVTLHAAIATGFGLGGTENGSSSQQPHCKPSDSFGEPVEVSDGQVLELRSGSRFRGCGAR